MLARLMDDIKSAPERLNTRRIELTHKLRQGAHTAKSSTAERLFDARVGALSKVEGLLDKVDELPVIKLVTGPAHNLAASRLDKATQPALEGYDELNARSVRDGLGELTRLQLVQLLRYESAHKARKTVIEAAEKAIAKLDQLPEPELPVATEVAPA
ncbi:MAG: hypothetical protein EP330_00985 [Deltaproteobacteria bacterium]|nr:MAG: hypothetical protein EP330_00985 [Deltaproteobacteria bacterium]